MLTQSCGQLADPHAKDVDAVELQQCVANADTCPMGVRLRLHSADPRIWVPGGAAQIQSQSAFGRLDGALLQHVVVYRRGGCVGCKTDKVKSY